eukprot:scaffold220351_cov50-Prasinocladus_malaysianus.AAC.1
MRSWKYLGKGSWAPKAGNKRRPPPMPRGARPAKLRRRSPEKSDWHSPKHQDTHRDQCSVATSGSNDRAHDTAEKSGEVSGKPHGHSDAWSDFLRMIVRQEHSASHSACRVASVGEVVETHNGVSGSNLTDEPVSETGPAAEEDVDPLQA